MPDLQPAERWLPGRRGGAERFSCEVSCASGAPQVVWFDSDARAGVQSLGCIFRARAPLNTPGGCDTCLQPVEQSISRSSSFENRTNNVDNREGLAACATRQSPSIGATG